MSITPRPATAGRGGPRAPVLVRPLEALEDRSVPATLVGLTTAGNLVTFDSATPAAIQKTVTVTGLGTDSLVGIDVRPATGALYGLGASSRLYILDPASGSATPVSSGLVTPFLSGASFGFDFNPAVDKLRVVSNTGQNLRVNADTNAVAGTDTPLAYDAVTFDAAVGGTAPAPQIVAEAYTKNADPATGKTLTTLYGIDSNLDVLVTQGGPGDDPTSPSPNGGQLFVVDKLGFDVVADAAFDIEAGTDAAFVVSGSKLYAVNLTTASSALLGSVGGAPLRGLAVAAPAAGPGTLQLSAAAFTFPASGVLAVAVTRTGGSTGAVTVNYATADGSATAGSDYLPAAGTLTFAAGQTTQTIFLSLVGGTRDAAPEENFTLTLSAPGGGATLGATAAATVTIPATAEPSGRFFVAGAGAGGAPVVRAFDLATRAEAFAVTAFDAAFTGGVTVATGDVNGDGTDDVVVGSGAGAEPRVRVFDGATKRQIAEFNAFEASFRGGVNVAVGDVTGDGLADIVVAPDLGGGPVVAIYDGDALAAGEPAELLRFFGIADPNFRGGARPAVGDLNADGTPDVIVAAGFQGGPRVALFSGRQLLTRGGEVTAAGGNPDNSFRLAADFFAFEDTLRNGAFVASGDVDGDGRADLIFGGGPRVRVFGGAQLLAAGAFSNLDQILPAQLGDFFAYDANLRGGVRVAAADVDADGTAEVLTGAGPGGPPTVRSFRRDGTAVSSTTAFDASFTGGVFVG